MMNCLTRQSLVGALTTIELTLVRSLFVLLDKHSPSSFNTHLSRERSKERERWRLDSTSSIIILKWKNTRRLYSHVRLLTKAEYTITIGRRALCDIITICASKQACPSFAHGECSFECGDDSYLFASDHFIHCSIFFLLSHRCLSTMFCSSLSPSLFLHQTIKSIIDDNSRRRLTVIIVSGIERHIRVTFTPLKYEEAYTYTDDDD